MTKKEFLSFSLPYNIKCTGATETHIYKLLSVHIGSIDLCRVKPIINGEVDFPLPMVGIKPILRPLSDISIEIYHHGEKFIPITKILEQSCFDTSKMTYKEQCSYINGFVDHLELLVLQDAILLLKWNFDIAGLIEKNEAIDYHTLEGFVF